MSKNLLLFFLLINFLIINNIARHSRVKNKSYYCITQFKFLVILHNSISHLNFLLRALLSHLILNSLSINININIYNANIKL